LKNAKIIKIIIGIMIIFLAYNIFWMAYVHIKYSRYTSQVERMDLFHYLEFDDDYGFMITLPAYLQYDSGNVSVSNPEGTVTFEIWPGFWGDETEYGLRIEDETTGEVYAMYIDADWNGLTAYDNEIIEKYQDEVNLLKAKAAEKIEW